MYLLTNVTKNIIHNNILGFMKPHKNIRNNTNLITNSTRV